MTDKKVWLVTGAGRGMGVDIAKAALAAGNAVVAGRNPGRVSAALGAHDDLLAVKLDVRHDLTPRRPCRRPSCGSDASTCWSTTPATAGSSRRSPLGTSGPRSRPPCSAP